MTTLFEKIKNFFWAQPEIVITLTTIPTRLFSNYTYDMRYCLESLLNQNYDGDFEVHLNIPYIFKQTGEEYKIPDWLKEMEISNKKLKIYRTEDFGPLTKSFPTIMRITNPETIIIVVDDDLVYNAAMITEHIKNQKKWPDNPVGYDGMRSRNDKGGSASNFKNIRDYYFSANYMDSRVDILQHYKSVSYKRRFFENDFESFIQENMFWSDDLVMAAYFSFKKVPRWCTYYPGDKKCETDEEWNNFVGISFPLLRHTQHEGLEGCSVERTNGNFAFENSLYKKYIDNGY
jgi:hypothetical protein